ncbi:MAG: DUF1097 domain-containing protein [Lachnospiraceae bacterium]|nr:DUF1097 domain-containing protein [Lachnospiraceae bacterium]
MKEQTINKLTLALGIALLPPIWAVLAPYAGITTGAVALICAGLYVTNGNKVSDALKITLGFLCGDIWAVIAVFLMEKMSFDPRVELYATLFVMGGIAVLIGETVPKFIFTPAWLCGWAIGLTIMGPMTIAEIGTFPIQIGAAMIAGVVYVGIGVDAFQKRLIKQIKKV